MPSVVPQSCLTDDHVLRDVDEAPGQVARVGGLERRVRQTLARTVGRDEVLEHREPLAEVRGDRRLDDLPRGLRHQSAHPGQLAHLLGGAPRARVGHHVDGVEARSAGAPRRSRPRGRPCRAARASGPRPRSVAVGPDVDHLVVALAVGDQAFLVLLLDLPDLFVRGGDEAAPCRSGSACRRCRSRCRPSWRTGSRGSAAGRRESPSPCCRAADRPGRSARPGPSCPSPD